MTALVLSLALSAAPFSARCQATLLQARVAPAEDLRSLLLALEPPVMGGGRAELPSLDAAIDALARSPSAQARADALDALAAVCAQAALPAGAPAPVDAAALARILERPQFAQRHGGEWAVARLLARLWDVLKELLQQRAVKDYSNAARTAFLGAVALLALYLGMRLWRGRHGPRAAVPARAVEARRTRAPAVDELLAEAQAALAGGDPRGAVRAQMRAVLAALAEKGLTDRRGAATNREVARALARTGDPELARLATDLAARFDRAIYGGAPLDGAAAAAFAQEAAAVRARAGAAP